MLWRVAMPRDDLPGFAGHFERVTIFQAMIGIRHARDAAAKSTKARFVGLNLVAVPTRLVIKIGACVRRFAARIGDQHSAGNVLQAADPELSVRAFANEPPR